MKRAPIVLSGTALGVAGLLSYHLAAPSSSIPGVNTAAASPAASTTSTTTTSTTTTRSSASPSRTTAQQSRTQSTSSQATSAAKSSSTTRTAIGEDVQFQYGDVQLKVTEKNGKLSKITVVRLDETDPRSEQIDEYAIPQLQQQALAAGSAHIDGVAGASYTSQAYAQSLQSALDKL